MEDMVERESEGERKGAGDDNNSGLLHCQPSQRDFLWQPEKVRGAGCLGA